MWPVFLLCLFFFFPEFNLFTFYLECYRLCQWSPTFLVPGTGFLEDNFSTDWGAEMVSGWLKHIKFIVHFISIIITLAPPQIFRHLIPEFEDLDLCNWEDSFMFMFGFGTMPSIPYESFRKWLGKLSLFSPHYLKQFCDLVLWNSIVNSFVKYYCETVLWNSIVIVFL